MSWAEVKANQVIRTIPSPKAMIINGTQHPANIFSNWSVDELKAIGIYSLVNVSNNLDVKTEGETGKVTYTINSNNVTQLHSKKDKDIDSVKENEIDTINNSQNTILNETDWYYIRKMDKGTDVPAHIQNYRDAVRVAGDKMISDVTAVTDKAGFQALYPIFDKDGKNIGGTLHVWPNIEDYPAPKE